jgi:hypothetical protein
VSLGDRFDHTQAIPGVLAALSTPEGVRDRARLSVASRATDADDCRDLLDAFGLGFTAEEVAAVKQAAANDTVIQAVSETEGRA